MNDKLAWSLEHARSRVEFFRSSHERFNRDAISAGQEWSTWVTILEALEGVASAPKALPAPVKNKGGRPKGSKNKTSKAKGGTIISAVQNILTQTQPMTTRAIIAALAKSGIRIGGMHPEVNLAAILRKDRGKFVSDRVKGWALREQAKAA